MVEVRQHPDGRTAVRVPVTVDDVVKGDCDWLSVDFTTGTLYVQLLTEAEVTDWTPLAPMPCGVASCPDYVSEV